MGILLCVNLTIDVLAPPQAKAGRFAHLSFDKLDRATVVVVPMISIWRLRSKGIVVTVSLQRCCSDTVTPAAVSLGVLDIVKAVAGF